MNVSPFALLLCILVWRSQSQETYIFTLGNKKSQNISVTTGSTFRFVCKPWYSGNLSHTLWIKDSPCIIQIQLHLGKCHKSKSPTCRNVTVPSNIECDTSTSIKIFNVSVMDSGGWSCRYPQSSYESYFSEIYYVEVKASTASTTPPKPSGTGSRTSQMEDTSISAGTSVKGGELTTINQPAQPTGSKPASNNILFLVVGAAVVGILIITLLAVVVALKRKKSHKGRRVLEPPNDDNVPEVEMIGPDGQYASIGQMKQPVAGGIATSSPDDDIVPAVEVVDPDGQYECIGQMKPSVAAGPVIEANPMYDSYEDNQNQNRNRNQNQDGGISLTQGDEGDVYSVVNKPGKSTVQASSGVVDTGGDVYSVVQKKKQDATATDGVQAGTPDHDISDVYSVVQKPDKTQQ